MDHKTVTSILLTMLSWITGLVFTGLHLVGAISRSITILEQKIVDFSRMRP